MQTAAIAWYLRRHSEMLKNSKKSLKREFIFLNAEKEFYSTLKKLSNKSEEKSKYSSISNVANSTVFLDQDPHDSYSPVNKIFLTLLDSVIGKETRTYHVKSGNKEITYEAKDAKTAFYDQFIRYKKESLGKEKEALAEHAFHNSSVTLLENNSPVTESYSYKIQIHNHRNKVFKSIYDKPEGYISFAKIESGKWFVISTVGMNFLIKPLPESPPIEGEQDFHLHEKAISGFIDELWTEKPIHSPQPGDNFESTQGLTHHYEYNFIHDTKKRDHTTLSSFTKREVEKLLLDMVEVFKNTLRDTEWWEYMTSILPGFKLLQRLSHDGDYNPKPSEYAFELFEFAFMLFSLGISVKSLAKNSIKALLSAFTKAKLKGITGKALIKIMLNEAARQSSSFNSSLTRLILRMSLSYISPIPFLDNAAIFGVRKLMHRYNKMLLGKAINPASFYATGKKMMRPEGVITDKSPTKVIAPKDFQGTDYKSFDHDALLNEAFDPLKPQWQGGRNIDGKLKRTEVIEDQLIDAENEILDITQDLDDQGKLKGGVATVGKKHAQHIKDSDFIYAYEKLTDNNNDVLDAFSKLRAEYKNSPDKVVNFFMDEFKLNQQGAKMCARDFFKMTGETEDIVKYTKSVDLENIWLAIGDRNTYSGFTIGSDPMKRIVINYNTLSDIKSKRTIIHEASHFGSKTGDIFYHADVDPDAGYSDIPGSIRTSLHKGFAADDLSTTLWERTKLPPQEKYLLRIENELGSDVIDRSGRTACLNREAFDDEMEKLAKIKNNDKLPVDERIAAQDRLRSVRDTIADAFTEGTDAVRFTLKNNADTFAFTVQAMLQKFFPSHNIIKRNTVPQQQKSDKSMMHLLIYLSAKLAKKQ